MTTITQDVTTIVGMDDNASWTFSAKYIRLSSTGDAIVSTKKERKYPVAGILTVGLDPGPAVVLAPDGKTYPFTVPATDSELWPLIQAAVTIPATTTHQQLLDAVDAWLEVNTTSQVLASPAATGTYLLSNYANLQAAINACSAAGGGVVQLPAGATVVGARIEMKSKVVVQGPQQEWTVSAYAADPTVYQASWLVPDTSTTNAVVEFPSDCLGAGLENVLIKGQLTRNGVEFNGNTTRGGNRLRNVYVWHCNKGITGDQQEVRLRDVLVMACASDGVTVSGQDWEWEAGVVGYNGGTGITLGDASGPIRANTVDTFFNTGHGLIIDGYGHRLDGLIANDNGKNGVFFRTAVAATISNIWAAGNGQEYNGTTHTTRYADVLFGHPTDGNNGCSIIGGTIFLPDGSGAPTKCAVESAEANPNFPNLIGIDFAGTYFLGASPFQLVSPLSNFVAVGCNNVPNIVRPQGGASAMYAALGTADLVQFVNDSFAAVSGVRTGGAFYGASAAIGAAGVSGTPTLDARTANVWYISLDANVTSTTVTNLKAGQVLSIWYGQDGTGSRTYVWPTNCRFAGAAAPTPTTTSGRADMVTFISDGTVLREMSRSIGIN